MLLISALPYDQTDFIFVSNHYDIHLSGLCKYDGKLCYFETFDDGESEPVCEIYSLSFFEKLKELCDKKMFEMCVGYNWTYPYRKTGEMPFRMTPWLFKLYYRLRGL